MQVVFVLSVILFAMTTIAKAILHVSLDRKNGHRIYFARSMGYIYLLPYDKDVAPHDEPKKRACNILQKFMILFFVVIIIMTLLKVMT
jgi:hypothetical protein